MLEPTLAIAGIYKEGLIEELASYQIQELDITLVSLLYYRTLI